MKIIKELVKDTFLYSFWVVLSTDPASIEKRHYMKKPKVTFHKTQGFSGKHFIMKGVSI